MESKEGCIRQGEKDLEINPYDLN